MSELINSTPNIDFINTSPQKIIAEMVSDYEAELQKLTGKREVLPKVSEERIFINTQALKLYQLYETINNSAKMNLLPYAVRGYLDNIGVMVGVTRLPPQSAVVTVRFTLSAAQEIPITIPKGTRVSTAEKLYFQVTKDAVIKPGSESTTAVCRCLETGSKGNRFLPGSIHVLVDTIPYVSKVSNVDISQGGADVEDDESLRERISIKPQSFSVAGPKGAYMYFVKEYSQAIEDVEITSSVPGTVEIFITLKGGEIPSEPFVEGLTSHLENKKPDTDKVVVSAPKKHKFSVNLTYFTVEKGLENQALQAVEKYTAWQTEKIGRDINPNMLVKMLLDVGVKRVELSEPTFTKLAPTDIPVLEAKDISFGGVEDE